MKERPILFSAPMVRALLDGSKTQTRRAMRNQVAAPAIVQMAGPGYCEIENEHGVQITGWNCPYGQPGDRLRVRETFFAYGRWETRYSEKKKRDEWHFVDMTLECDRIYQYAVEPLRMVPATGRGGMAPAWYKRPAIFMPRAASRILLEVVSVRVERLKDISHEDAEAEGVKCNMSALGFRDHYRNLWERINGAGSWDVNSWVWVITFRRIAA